MTSETLLHKYIGGRGKDFSSTFFMKKPKRYFKNRGSSSGCQTAEL